MDNLVWNQIDSRNICYGGTWNDVQSTIRATVFAVMLELAQDRVKHYRSDLYHDAMWLAEQVTCPISFDWVVRESGTFIGDSAGYCKLNEWDKSVKYRFEILNEGSIKWKLNIHEATVLPVPVVPQNIHFCEQCGAKDAHYVNSLEIWVCSIACKEQFLNLRESSMVERFCNETPLPENVVTALVNTDVNPINWTPEKVEEIVNQYDAENSLNPYAEMNAVHEALPIGECELATTAAGCIYHSAPPISKFHTYTDEEKIAIAEATFPTLRNDSSITDTIHKDGNRKVINMESILRELREKLDEANSARDEAYDAKSQLDDAISEFDEYIDEMDNLIGSLDNLPSISIDLDVRVEFDS